MEEPTTHLGASSRHAYCRNYQFRNGVPLKMLGREEEFADITWLDVKNCTGVLYEDTFKNLPKLEILNLTNCNFDQINSTFKNMSQLRSLDVWRSQVPLNKSVFEGCNKLNSVRVINCEDIVIEEDSFMGLQNLENLMIQKNNFSVGDQMFSMLGNLKYLFLQGCEVNFLTKNPFVGLNNLNFLGINSCKLKNISEDAFLQLDKLDTLLLNCNTFEGENFDFENLSKLKNLETISFPVEILEKLDFSKFEKLKIVQFELDNEKADSLINSLKEKNIDCEWCSSGEIPEFDENNPNIQICA